MLHCLFVCADVALTARGEARGCKYPRTRKWASSSVEVYLQTCTHKQINLGPERDHVAGVSPPTEL